MFSEGPSPLDRSGPSTIDVVPCCCPGDEDHDAWAFGPRPAVSIVPAHSSFGMFNVVGQFLSYIASTDGFVLCECVL